MARPMTVTDLADLIFLCASAASASNPGEPLDCSDWVFLGPHSPDEDDLGWSDDEPFDD